MRSIVRICVLTVTLALLLAGCGEDSPRNGIVTEAVPPGDIFGLIGEFGAGDREHVMALAWSVDDSAAISGFHVYRRIAPGEYERITVDPVEFVDGDGFRYLDHDADIQSVWRHSYYATTVGPLQWESDPSEEVSVVPALISPIEPVVGLAPSGNSTVATLTPIFVWAPKDGAVTYCILLQDLDDPTNPIVWMYRDSETSFESGATLGATYVPLDGGRLESDSFYRWQILAIDASNMVFAWQEAYFQTAP